MPEFNPGLGSLTGIDLNVSLTHQGEVDIYNVTGSSQPVSDASSSIPIELDTPTPGVLDLFSATASLRSTTVGTSPPAIEYPGTGFKSWSSFSPLDLADYVGVGNGDYELFKRHRRVLAVCDAASRSEGVYRRRCQLARGRRPGSLTPTARSRCPSRRAWRWPCWVVEADSRIVVSPLAGSVRRIKKPSSPAAADEDGFVGFANQVSGVTPEGESAIFRPVACGL